MKKICMGFAAALLLLPSCALAEIEAQPEAGGEVAAGDVVTYTVTVEADDPDGQVHIVLSEGMELQQDSVLVSEGDLYFGSDGFVLMTELASGDKIEFSATVGEEAKEAICTVTGSVEETVRHTITLPLEEPVNQSELAQETMKGEEPANMTWGWIALAGAALAGGSCWGIYKVIGRKKAVESSTEDGPNKPAGV